MILETQRLILREMTQADFPTLCKILQDDEVMYAYDGAFSHDEVHTGVNWNDVGVDGNVNWLIDVSKEMIPVLRALVNRHIEDNVPIIIEGDFINPEFTKSFDNPEVKSIFVNESDKNQILQNYLSREGGDLQHYRADISIAYGKWIVDTCNQNGIKVIESRPWDTLLTRAIKSLL